MRTILALLIIGIAVSCQQKVGFDENQAREEIMKLHHAQRDHHFQKDSISFVDQFSPEIISVNRGVIARPTYEESLSRYHRYFSAVTFVKWDDLQEPVIRFSADGTLAYTIVDKMVQVEYGNQDGEPILGETHFAWLAIYRRSEEGWKIESMASTNVPDNP